MITEDQIKEGVEIVGTTTGYTRSARNGEVKTVYRIGEQIDRYEWKVLILENERGIFPEGLRSTLCLAAIKRCRLK